MTGAASTSAPTAAGARATSAGTSPTAGRGRPGTAEGCHDATGGVAGGQIGYRWQTAAWVFGLEAQGDWADLKGSNASLLFGRSLFTNHTQDRRASACSPARSVTPGTTCCSTSRAAPPSPATSTTAQSPATGVIARPRQRNPLGWHGRRRPRISASRRTGRPRSNTITCSWAPQQLNFTRTSRRSRACFAHRSHPPGRRSRHRPRQLSLGRPGDREVLISA